MNTAITNNEFSRAYVERRIKELSPWYHKIDLGGGIITPGRDYDALWVSTRAVMDKVDYGNKRVLDLASWDGYWAFEAERRGAQTVVSTDVRLQGYENLLFAKAVLGSKVIPMCNAPVQDIRNRVKVVGLEPEFDIVHHFGLFYHLRDPLLSLAQVRTVMPVGALLILETAFIDDNENSYMAFAGLPDNFHFYGISDTWAPTLLCLREVLIRSMFMPVMENAWSSVEPTKNVKERYAGKIASRIGHVTMIAKAVDEGTVHNVDRLKIMGDQ